MPYPSAPLTGAQGAYHLALEAFANALFAELGPDPAGENTTVTERLAALNSTAGNLFLMCVDHAGRLAALESDETVSALAAAATELLERVTAIETELGENPSRGASTLAGWTAYFENVSVNNANRIAALESA